MKKIPIIIAALVLILLVIVAIYLFIQSSTTNSQPVQTNTGSFNSAVDTPINKSSANTIVITEKDGTPVQVPDFTKTNQPKGASATSGYQVAGANTSDFQILYYPQGSGFLITILSEPIGIIRLEAESALRKELGLSDTQLCSLNIDVQTTEDVNQTYAGSNLGLSFCPGSIALPQ